MTREELTTYLDRTVEEAFAYYCSRESLPEGRARSYQWTPEQADHWTMAVGLLADMFEDAAKNIDWDRDERDI